MSLFIHKENQEVLWNIINKTPLFKNTFQNSHPQVSQEWFRSSLESYYFEKNIEKQPIDKTNLIIFNKNALSYMMQRLMQTRNPPQTNMHVQMPPPPPSASPQQPMTSNLFMETTYSRNANSSKENTYMSQYEMRQKEYEQMFAKPKPDINPMLNDNIKDEAITNMEELIEQHRRQREEELQLVQPPNVPANISAPSPILPNTKIQIQETTHLEPNIVYEITEPPPQPQHPPKNVTWKDEVVQQNLEEDVQKLKLQVVVLENKLKDIESFVYHLQAKQAKEHTIESTENMEK